MLTTGLIGRCDNVAFQQRDDTEWGLESEPVARCVPAGAGKNGRIRTMMAICLVSLWLALRFLPKLIVEFIATLIASALSLSSRRLARALLDGCSDTNLATARWDDRPTRAERRLLARSLDIALSRTELRSLFPGVVADVDASHFRHDGEPQVATVAGVFSTT